MRFEEFWDRLSYGGKTPEDDEYNIVGNNRLHIRSRGNKNLKYKITKDTVKKYFEKIPTMDETKFRYQHSSYFYNVYRHIVKKLNDKKS